MKIVTVVGARPQFVKASTVSRVVAARDGVEEVLVHTGQHYDDKLSELFFTDLRIPRPEYNLGIGSASHGVQTGRMLAAVEDILVTENPDWVLVYGDTNSTLAGALAAAKLNQRIAHVEAGLRSFNRQMPEEINRVLTDALADVLFTPVAGASAQLRSEGVPETRIFQVGDVMVDAVLHGIGRAERKSTILKDLNLTPGSYCLATVHRAENTDNPTRLSSVFSALGELSRERTVILPLHPRTSEALSVNRLQGELPNTLRIVDPVGYLDMLVLEKNADFVATDSGGVPKEAFILGVPSIILRRCTEWEDLVELGWARTVDPFSKNSILRELRALLEGERRSGVEPFGDGHAAERIVDELVAVHGTTLG
ncbi:MAG: UDP-N-acetylglucosamine 2-epimerase (non-hydrolyzing) [bacterium]|nr:UDP-N-acetylglucosamine 2-epimerase (non-hydrolyzing) [bacterium]